LAWPQRAQFGMVPMPAELLYLVNIPLRCSDVNELPYSFLNSPVSKPHSTIDIRERIFFAPLQWTRGKCY